MEEIIKHHPPPLFSFYTNLAPSTHGTRPRRTIHNNLTLHIIYSSTIFSNISSELV